MEDVGHVVLEHQQFFHPNINIHPRNHGLVGDLYTRMRTQLGCRGIGLSAQQTVETGENLKTL